MAVYPGASESSLGSTNGFNDDEYARFLAPGAGTLLTNVQREMIRLFRAGQFESVEILARFEYPKSSYLCGLLLGDCAYEAGNYRQAQHFYRQAVHHDPALFRHREARCLERQGSLVEATSVLEQISHGERNFAVLLLLGSLYVRT
jgi:tetratricopeptide (TPR) repeat protein